MKEKWKNSKHNKSKDSDRKSKRCSQRVSTFYIHFNNSPVRISQICHLLYYYKPLLSHYEAKHSLPIFPLCLVYCDYLLLLITITELLYKVIKLNFYLQSSSSSGSESDEWVEQETRKTNEAQREDWMSMTGMLKTYTKEDIRPKREETEKKNIDSYNPGTSSRELNPYWKNGGTGLPQTPEAFRKSKPFLKPSDDDDDYYSKSRSSRPSTSDRSSSRSSNEKPKEHYSSRKDSSRDSYRQPNNWRKSNENRERKRDTEIDAREELPVLASKEKHTETLAAPEEKLKDTKYLSDDKLNKLAAKILKAEILGDGKLVTELKSKLEAAREYRKQNPEAGKEDEDDRVMLISTSMSGNSRPLASSQKGDPRSKSGKRKAETHTSGERTKYFGDDDKYNLAQMVSLFLFINPTLNF